MKPIKCPMCGGDTDTFDREYRYCLACNRVWLNSDTEKLRSKYKEEER